MSVVDGTAVSAAVTNPAFLKPDVDDYTVAKLGMHRPTSPSGYFVADIQRYINNVARTIGLLYTGNYTAEADTSGNDYGSTSTLVPDGTDFKDAITTILNAFSTGGHAHTGSGADGQQISLNSSVTGFLPIGNGGTGNTGTTGDVHIYQSDGTVLDSVLYATFFDPGSGTHPYFSAWSATDTTTIALLSHSTLFPILDFVETATSVSSPATLDNLLVDQRLGRIRCRTYNATLGSQNTQAYINFAMDAAGLDQSNQSVRIDFGVNDGTVTAGNTKMSLKSDGTLNLANFIATGVVVNNSSGNLSSTSGLANSYLATMANNTVKGNVSGGAAVPSDLSLLSTATASTVMYRDSHINTNANNFVRKVTSTATAGATTTLTVNDSPIQVFTGSTTQTINLPDATTLPQAGYEYFFVNQSSGTITIKDNSNSTIQAMLTGTYASIVATSISTTAGTWYSAYSTNGSGTGTVSSVSVTVPSSILAVSGSPITSSGTIAITALCALGDIIYGSATNTYSALAGNTTSTKKFLTQTGTGAVSAAPAWGTIVAGDVPASLTGLTTASALVTVGTITSGTWSATAIAALRGGTGIDTSGSTGVPSISSGTWSVAAALANSKGGTGGDSSASTGIAHVATGTWSYSTIVNADVSNSAAIVSSKISFTTPTFQRFTTGSGTYTTPAGVKYIIVDAVGAGGGGAGSGVGGNGGTGGTVTDTTFGSSFLTAGKGTSAAGGVSTLANGGTNTINSPAVVIQNVPGGQGGGAQYQNISTIDMCGGPGGVSFLGGNGVSAYNANGGAARANTGSGGGGGGCGAFANCYSGPGGGAGGYLKALIDGPSSSYSYVVGAGGSAGSAGTNGQTGGAGSDGLIVVWEYYS